MDWIAFTSSIRFGEQFGRMKWPRAHKWSHLFDDYDYWLILGGKGWITINGQTSDLRRGTAVIFRPGDQARAWHDPDDPLLLFLVHFQISDNLAKDFSIFPSIVLLHDVARMEDDVTSLRAASRDNSKEGDALAKILLTRILLQAILDSRSPATDEVEVQLFQICRRIEAMPEDNWRAEKLAALAGLSLSQFNRRFRMLTGTSPMRFIITKRIDRAKWLLSRTTMNLKQIAEELKYSDIYYFHSQFRREAGRSPGSYRRESQKQTPEY